MQIEKVSFNALEKTQISPEKAAIKREFKNEISKEYQEKSNAAKYMTGASALSSVIAFGIKESGDQKKADNRGQSKQLVSISRRENGTNESKVFYDKSGKPIVEIIYEDDGKTVDYSTRYDYDPITGNKTKETNYNADGKIFSVSEFEYDSKGNLLEETNSVGSYLAYIKEFSPKTGKLLKQTDYYQLFGGDIVQSVAIYDPVTGNQKEGSCYTPDGKLGAIIEYDPAEDGKRIKETHYQRDGKTIKSIIKYPSEPGDKIICTTYQRDGKTIKDVIKCDNDTKDEMLKGAKWSDNDSPDFDFNLFLSLIDD